MPVFASFTRSALAASLLCLYLSLPLTPFPRSSLLVAPTPVPITRPRPLIKTRGIVGQAPWTYRPTLRERLAATSGKVVARFVAAQNSFVAFVNNTSAFISKLASQVAYAGLAVIKKPVAVIKMAAAATLALASWLFGWVLVLMALFLCVLAPVELFLVFAPRYLFILLAVSVFSITSPPSLSLGNV